MKQIALIGGAFNPVHNGHLFLANEVQKHFSNAEIWFIPSSLSAHKSNSKLEDSQHRIAMLKLALKATDYKFDLCEIKRGGVSYTIDTVRRFKSIYGSDCKIFVVIGDDLISGLSHWKESENLLKEVQFIVGSRDCVDFKLPKDGIALHNSLLPLSSTVIRNAVKNHQSIDQFLPKEVASYIIENHLYLEN